MRSIHLLIKPASGMCNIRCRYCFYCDITQKREEASYGIMSLETLENMIRRTFETGARECTFAYQGGEPTLAGLEFFRESIRLQKKYNTNRAVIHNAIQTNGMVIDDEWAKFFAENNFLVGLSMDGGKDTHDRFRVDAKGEGTFNRVQKTARLFEKYGVEYNILTVVNSVTAKKIESIYSFFKKNNYRYLQFIPCLDPLGEEIGGHDYSLTPEMFGEFLNRLFRLWYRDVIAGQGISIRTFDNYITMLMGYPPECCGMSGICSMQNVVEADGSVYPCDFYVLDEYRLGNLNTDSFDAIDEKRRELRFIEDSALINEECKQCPYFSICRGGCRRMRMPEEGYAYPMNYFCESYKMFFSENLPKMQALASELRRRQRGF